MHRIYNYLLRLRRYVMRLCIDKYLVSFIEEGVFNHKGYVGGRVEVYHRSSQYAIEEIRFFTKDRSFYDFREAWDFRTVNKKRLDELRKIIKDKYYDTNI